MEVWGITIAAGIVSSMVMYVLEGCKLGITDVLFQSVSHFMNGGASYDPSNTAGKIFSSFFSFTMLLLTSAYTANLATYLIHSAQEVQRVTSIESFTKLG